jgi:hypothetical protein
VFSSATLRPIPFHQVSGLTGRCSAVLLVVAANTGVSTMTREHLGLAIALRLPLIVVVSKIDMAHAAVLNRTIDQVRMWAGAGMPCPRIFFARPSAYKGLPQRFCCSFYK